MKKLASVYSLSGALARGMLCTSAVLCGAVLVTGCQGGIAAGSTYPDYDSSAVEQQLLSPENESSPSTSLGNFIISEEACEGLSMHTELRPIAQDDLSRHLQQIGAPPVQIKARGNLYWFDFPGTNPDGGDVVRLRLAVLEDAKEAADELHAALLEHGPGWWGIRRSNLSILAPKAGVTEALAFALKYKLVCWGMISMAGLDDVYVVPGPYMEM